MDKRKQRFSIGYFIVAMVILFLLQYYFAAPKVETIGYSQFKSLVKKGLVTNLVINDETIRGEIKPEGVKEVLSPEQLKARGDGSKDDKTNLPFVTVRIEDPDLIDELEAAGVPFKGEVVSQWLPTLLSWVVPVALFFLL